MYGPDSATQSDQRHDARKASARALMAQWAREDETSTTSTTDTVKAAR